MTGDILRRTPTYLRRTPPPSSKTSFFDLRLRRTKNPPPSIFEAEDWVEYRRRPCCGSSGAEERRTKNTSIFNLRSSAPKNEELPIFDLRPRRSIGRFDRSWGKGGFFEDGKGLLRRWGVISVLATPRLRRTKNPSCSIFETRK